MKTVLRFAILALLLLAIVLLVPSGTVVMAEDGFKEYELSDKVCIKPNNDCYTIGKNTWDYEDPSISVHIECGRMFETNYMVAHVKIANATQIRSAMEGSYYNPSTIAGASMARSVNAVFAINGDFFSSRNNIGYVCRQGKQYRLKCNGKFDVLIIDDKGDLHIIPKAMNEDIEAFEGTPVNGYTFGPGLIIDGVPVAEFESNKDTASDDSAQRMCIAQVGELEYLCICSEGPEDKGSVGLTIKQFAELVSTFDGIINAYNLDGGSSSTMAFKDYVKGKLSYKKINCPNNTKVRPLCDIIYFATAYQN